MPLLEDGSNPSYKPPGLFIIIRYGNASVEDDRMGRGATSASCLEHGLRRVAIQ